MRSAAECCGAGAWKERLLLFGACAAGLMMPLELTTVSVALPEIARSLGLASGATAWVVDAYLLGFAGAVMAAGAIADRIGRSRGFQVGLLLFGVTSLACGLSRSGAVLLLSRTVQGSGAALMVSAGMGLLSERFAGRRRFNAFGAFTTMVGIGLACGPVIGGLLTAGLGWSAVFLVNLPIIAAASVASAVQAERPVPDQGAAAPFHAGTISALAMGVTLIVASLLEATDLGPAGAATVSLAGVALAVSALRRESRSRVPMFSAASLLDPEFLGVQVATLAYSAAFGMLLVYLPQVAGDRGAFPGSALAPMTAPVLIVPIIAARLADRWPPNVWFGTGLVLAGGGVALLAIAALQGRPHGMMSAGALALTGIGFAVCNAHLTNIAVRLAGDMQPATASALNFAVRQTSIAVGVAAASTALSVRSGLPPLLTLAGLAGFICIAGAAVTATLSPRTWPNLSHGAVDERGR